MGEAVRNELWDAGAATQLFPDVEPTTLHRLLGLGPRRRAAIPIDADMVIVDEASMVSLPLMANCCGPCLTRPASCSSGTPGSWPASRPARCSLTSWARRCPTIEQVHSQASAANRDRPIEQVRSPTL
jgi:hypothetical protein